MILQIQHSKNTAKSRLKLPSCKMNLNSFGLDNYKRKFLKK